MDACLKRFGEEQSDPLGEKTEQNVDEPIFTPHESEYENNHIGAAMQSGWKIGAQFLRAAKVGIVNKIPM